MLEMDPATYSGFRWSSPEGAGPADHRRQHVHGGGGGQPPAAHQPGHARAQAAGPEGGALAPWALLSALRNLCSFSPANRRRTPSIMQQEAAECGAACLAMVPGPLRPVGEPGVPARAVRGQPGRVQGQQPGAHGRALRPSSSRGFSLDLRDLKGLPFPFIAFWGFNHFVVVEGLSSSRAWLNDPATGPAHRVHGGIRRLLHRRGPGLCARPGLSGARARAARPGLPDPAQPARGAQGPGPSPCAPGPGSSSRASSSPGANRIFVDDILVKGERGLAHPPPGRTAGHRPGHRGPDLVAEIRPGPAPRPPWPPPWACAPCGPSSPCP